MTQIELKEMSDRDLLVQAVTVLNDLSGKMETILTEGMPRCMMHQEQMAGLGKRVGRFSKAAYACGLIFLGDLVARAWR